jgi:catechol 2,3-dioxygenase
MRVFLPEQTRVSQVHLRAANLKKTRAFYTDVLGLKVSRGGSSQTVLSAAPGGPALVALTEDLDAPSRLPRSTGLYHFAIRYPGHQDLARAYHRVVRADYPVAGASDHGVSEAIYLNDPEGNGVELYADRPRSRWPRQNGQIAMVTRSLDLDELLSAVPPDSAAAEPPAETDIGHVHLHVADLAAAERFYGEFLGLALTQRSYPGALFFAAGGYHHHIGVNVWAGSTVSPAGSVGLVSYRVEVPITEILYCLNHRAPLLGYETRPGPREEGGPVLQIRDPNGMWLEVQASPTAALPSNSCHEESPGVRGSSQTRPSVRRPSSTFASAP